MWEDETTLPRTLKLTCFTSLQFFGLVHPDLIHWHDSSCAHLIGFINSHNCYTFEFEPKLFQFKNWTFWWNNWWFYPIFSHFFNRGCVLENHPMSSIHSLFNHFSVRSGFEIPPSPPTLFTRYFKPERAVRMMSGFSRERVISPSSTDAHRLFHLIQAPNNRLSVRWVQKSACHVPNEGRHSRAALEEARLLVDAKRGSADWDGDLMEP